MWKFVSLTFKIFSLNYKFTNKRDFKMKVSRLGGVRGAILYYRAPQLHEFEVASCRTCRLRSKKAILEVSTSNFQKRQGFAQSWGPCMPIWQPLPTCFLFSLQPAPMVTKARPMLPLAFLILTNLNLVANLQTAIGTTVTKTHLRRPQILRIILNKNPSSIKKPTQTAKNQSHLKKFVKTPLLLMEVPPEASLTKPIPFPVLLLLPLPAPPPRLWPLHRRPL